MSDQFTASVEFTDSLPYSRKRFDIVQPLSFGEKIKGWLERASMYPERYDYDPAAYSVEEWEAYLLKKNNNMTFAQFLRRPRWSLSKYWHRGFDELRDALREAQEKSDEFLSEAQLEYVGELLKTIKYAQSDWEKDREKAMDLYGRNALDAGQSKVYGTKKKHHRPKCGILT